MAARIDLSRGRGMKHHRVNKLSKPVGKIVKKKDVVANNDQQAVETAEQDQDCPICEVWRGSEKVGSVT